MTRLFLPFVLILLLTSNLYASQSTIIEVDGIACMGYDRPKHGPATNQPNNASK